MYLPEVDGDCFSISTQLKAPEAEQLQPNAGRDFRVPENITWMQALMQTMAQVVPFSCSH